MEAEPAVLTGDRQLLERMTWNLAENAVLYNRRGGFVRMTVKVVEGRATVRVTNSGPVVPVESIELLLEPFQRLGRGAGQGAGVGLSLVRAVAEVHGGTVQLEPRDGGGIVAEVRLPLERSGLGDDAGLGYLLRTPEQEEESPDAQDLGRHGTGGGVAGGRRAHGVR